MILLSKNYIKDIALQIINKNGFTVFSEKLYWFKVRPQ